LLQRVRELHKTHGPSSIAKLLDLDVKFVRNLVALSGSKIGLPPKGYISYEEWKKSTEVKLSTIFLPIISKEISLENEICDITIDSPNQSFICGDNFCVHNCPRLVYESSMMKQALGVYALSYKNRFDTISHVMAYPQKALVDTKYNKMLHYDEMLTGINPIVAIMCYTGFNQEDSVILNKASVDRGLFVTTAYRTMTCEEKKKTNCSFEKIETPPLASQSKAMNYSKLAKNGIVHKGVPVYKGDVIVGKTLTKVQKEEQEEKIDCSLSISSGEEGIIDEIWIGKNEEGYMMVKVKIRQIRIPEVGDKMASRSSQKGVCGLLLEQENMPFTQQGITPDLLMNAHCFTAETQISLCNGLSKPISKMFVQGGEHVWTHNKVNKEEGDSGIIVGVNKSMGCGGVKKIVKLTMEDGRIIRCTPNHKFYTKNGDWIEAQDMELGTTQLQMSIEGVEDVVSETEYEIEQKWEFAEFNMKTNENREKSMAFARILGYLLTDGCICESRQRYSCPISFGHKMDAELCIQDIYLLTGISPKICENDSDYGNVYIVNLPSCLVEIIIRLDGITIGRRTEQETTWPYFIFDSPLSFVREFLGGLFGGDGHAPYIKGEHVNEIRFSQSSNIKYEESFTKKMQLLCDLLNRFGVDASIERTRYYYKYANPRTLPLPTEFQTKMANIYIIVKNTLAFTQKIGMRYCIEKMCRLSLYKSYKLLQQRVKDQSEAVFGLVNEYMKEKKSTEKSIELARSEFFETNTNLNNYYTFGISGKTQIGNRRKPNRSSDVLHLSYKYFPTFKQYIEGLGCSEWYSKDKYIVDKEKMAIPTFFMRVIGRVDDGEEPIYCFNVEKHNNFISQGVLCSNSIPSRMTMSQMLECMYSKVCALGGTFGDSTAFSDASIDPVEDISKKLQAFGFQKYGNERMYSGFTGEMLDAEIFIGPTYYQRLKHLVADKIHCLTTDHDVLTRNGWKPICEITLDDKVATLDKNGYLVYQEPKSIMNYPEYRGNMYYVKTDNIDLAVTANHRMWVKDTSSTSYDFKRADELVNIPVYYKNNANWRENTITSVTEDKIIELVFELKLLKTEFVPEWIFMVDTGYVRIFFDTLNDFTSGSKYIIDQLQQLLLHSGGWSGVVIRNESTKTYTLLIDKSEKDPFVYGGDRLVENQKCHVVCLSVPNEIFYVRRNGKAVWTGNSRATGNVTMMHHQPSEGRSREGGLRVGEMERDALISHGGAAFIQETLFDMSDQYQINVCETCGNIVSSATACRMCKTGQINRTNIPYCAKLLFQELEAMGINIQINTKEEKKEEKKDVKGK
jgi:intein/homing endonuclease